MTKELFFMAAYQLLAGLIILFGIWAHDFQRIGFGVAIFCSLIVGGAYQASLSVPKEAKIDL